jgi:RNA recognition motif-containing protein
MRIYVGGLTYATSNNDLRDLFAQAGQVNDANVVEDKYSGQSRGFGFVEMPNNDEANAAISRFNGYTHDGRGLTVNEAKPREDRGGGYAGSSGGGNRSGSNRW